VLLPTLAGMALVIGSACVFNNYLDRGLDRKMARTKNRSLVTGAITGRQALIFASLLGVVGFLILGFYTNWLVFITGALAIFSYVIVYGLAKRHTVHSTLIGSLPGAAPPVAGYLAFTNHVDAGASLLFLILVFWQMPHFYAIAMYRYKDYKAAGLPILTVRYGMPAARRQTLGYIVLFTLACAAMTLAGPAGYVFLAIMTLTGAYWLIVGIRGYSLSDSAWGRRMFLTSLKVTIILSTALATGSRLP
jgi:protoheme IX farnesyltransferase